MVMSMLWSWTLHMNFSWSWTPCTGDSSDHLTKQVCICSTVQNHISIQVHVHIHVYAQNHIKKSSSGRQKSDVLQEHLLSHQTQKSESNWCPCNHLNSKSSSVSSWQWASISNLLQIWPRIRLRFKFDDQMAMWQCFPWLVLARSDCASWLKSKSSLEIHWMAPKQADCHYCHSCILTTCQLMMLNLNSCVIDHTLSVLAFECPHRLVQRSLYPPNYPCPVPLRA